MLPDKPAYPVFRPRAPWIGGDLQTLRNFIVRPRPGLPERSSSRIEFVMPDGSGDRLSGVFSVPSQAKAGAPLLVLIHGLTGDEDSFYMLESARRFLSLGIPVLRLNLRGAGPTRDRCLGQYHAGRTEDLVAVLAQLARDGIADEFVLFGYSLGANMMLKFLGEGGAPGVRAAVAVSAPIDLALTSERFVQPRNRPYHNWLLAKMKAEALAGKGLSAPEEAAIRTARTTIEFDDRFVARRAGLSGAREYYARCSAKGYMADIAVPTLVVHALDDPWIPGRIYLDYDWAGNPRLTPLLPFSGGHVGFHEPGGTWHDRVAGLFLSERGLA